MSETKGVQAYRCPRCHWSDFFETKTCPQCRSKMSEVLLSGMGKIATFTVIRYPPKTFEKDTPYVVGLVDLENGPRVIGRITANPEELQISKAVQCTGKTDGVLWFRI